MSISREGKEKQYLSMSMEWEKIDQIFHQALECAKENRAEFIARACHDDPALQQEIQTLIAFHEEDENYMETPVLKTSLSPQFNTWQEEIVDKLSVGVISQGEDSEAGRMSGQIIDGKYRIEELLGRGGMGAVYRATHVGTGRVVALKVMASDLAGDNTFVERFRREAKTIGRLNHPNIVDVKDFGFSSSDGETVAYLVMEYLEGRTLAERLKDKQPLPFNEVITILTQVGAAIDEAHRLGILHRDLKPENIWLGTGSSDNFNVKVLDFGLADLHYRFQLEDQDAKPTINVTPDYQSPFSVTEADTLRMNLRPQQSEPPAPWRGEASDLQRLSRVGTVMGTPVYMSPEQCRGERLDKTSDIYSLGVITYQMLAGEVPFKGTIPELLLQHREGSPASFREKRWDIPAGVDEVVRQALAKERTSRPATAGAFAFMIRLQAGSGEWIRKQARQIHRQYWLQLSAIAARVKWIYWIICGVLLFVALKLPGMFPVLSLVIFGLLWLVITFITVLEQNVTSAACVLFVDRKLGGAKSDDDAGFAVSAAKEQTAAIASAVMANVADFIRKLPSQKFSVLKNFPGVALTAPALVNEEVNIHKALERSETLMEPVRRIAIYPFVRSLQAIALALIAWQSMLILFSISLDGHRVFMDAPFARSILPLERFFMDGPFDLPILLLVPLLIFFISFRTSLKSSIEQAMLYLSARKARGEIAEDLQNHPATETRLTVQRSSIGLYTTTAFLILLIAGWQYFKLEAMPYLMERGSLNTVKALNVSGVPVPYWSNRAQLNAIWAASHPQMVRYFLDKGADANDKVLLPPLYGNVVTTPLMSAIMGRSNETAELLIRRGADLNAQDSKGRTPLMVAAIYYPQAVEQLIASGADIHRTTKLGNALHVAARYQWLYKERREHTREEDNVVRMLLENGVHPDAVGDREGRTALMLASIEKRMDDASTRTAEALLNAGANPNARDNNRRTPLMYAVKYKRYNLITLLLQRGADVNATDNNGISALKMAEKSGNMEIVRILSRSDEQKIIDEMLLHSKTLFKIK